MADMNQFITVTALRDLKAGEWVTTKDVGPAIKTTARAAQYDVLPRIFNEAHRVEHKTGLRPTEVILGTSEWAALEEWFRDNRRFFGCFDADLQLGYAQDLLGMRPVVDPTTESRITCVFGPCETFWRLGDIAQ